MRDVTHTVHQAEHALQIFTPQEIRTGVTTLNSDDCVAFKVEADCSISIDGGPSFSISAGEVIGFPINAATLTLSPASTVALM